jgi:glycosyltransferase involved in cell wall biosynthesis
MMLHAEDGPSRHDGPPSKLRIAEIAPPWFPVPPPAYGGIEAVVHALTEGLVARGHEVTLFAAPGSRTSAHVVSPLGRRVAMTDPDAEEAERDHVLRALESAAGFDVIHDHTAAGPVLAAPDAETLPPLIHTLHGPWTPAVRRTLGPLCDVVGFVAISDDQRLDFAGIRYAGRVYNGVDVERFRFVREKEPYLAFVGRSCHEKGPDRAIRIARASGMPLRMMVKRLEPPEIDYWRREVEPLLGDDIELVSANESTADLLGGASGTLFPVDWSEPFGMVMIESMACGTPVLASPVGSVPEVVVDGVTGFWCESEDEMVAAVARIGEIAPADCRRHVVDRFSTETMTAGYERIFRAAVSQRLAGGGSGDSEPVRAGAVASA